ncbi:MAG: FtsQ-type POTRA domain-containing protein [Candidatus Wildermuthbacteria bacterium]|nr:FtsQ-type POTRA domain-containing protein [Candidatus Wildermuthbacteria bacterium]
MRARKPKRFKRKRPLYQYGVFWIFFLLVLGTGGLGYFFFLSPVFEITDAQARGDNAEIEEKILPFIPRGNIFLLDVAELKQELEAAFPEIENVRVSRGLPHKVRVTFQKRVGVALWCREAFSCVLVDKNGVAFQESRPGFELLLYTSENPRIGQTVMEKERWATFLDFKARAEGIFAFQEPKFTFLSLDAVSETRADWKTSEKWEVYTNPKENTDWQLQKLQAVLEKKIPPSRRSSLLYIDLRFGDQAYIKYR